MRGRRSAPGGLHALCTVLGAVAVLLPSGTVGTAGTALAAENGYAYAPDARQADAADSPADAVRLEPGTSYTSSLPRSGTVYFRLDLDATSNAYVSVTAVPGAGARSPPPTASGYRCGTPRAGPARWTAPPSAPPAAPGP